MKKIACLGLAFVSLVALCIINFEPVGAAQTAIVVPDDYPTIQTAIGNATAGDTVQVKKGTYHEHSLVINKTLSLLSENANETTIECIDGPPPWDPGQTPFPPPAPDVIQISASEVKISGFTITGGGKGISTRGNGNQIIGNTITAGIGASGNATQIIDNVLQGGTISTSGWYQVIEGNTLQGSTIDSGALNSTVVGNRISGSGTGINLKGNFTLASNNTINGKGDTGLLISGSRNIVGFNNISQQNVGIGLLAYPSSPGSYNIGGSACDNNIVFSNNITNNKTGIQVQNGKNNTFYGNYIAGNEFGVSLSRNMTTGGNIQYLACYVFDNVFYHNNIVNNAFREAVDWSWQGTNSWDNGTEGNYWSDYIGLDVNQDGVGDIPYKINAPYTIFWSSLGVQPQDPTVVNNATDRYPLQNPFNISSLLMELPEWANPKLYPSTSPSPSPTPTVFPSQSPSLSPSPSIPEFPTWIILLIVTGTILLLVTLMKTKRSKETKRD